MSEVFICPQIGYLSEPENAGDIEIGWSNASFCGIAPTYQSAPSEPRLH